MEPHSTTATVQGTPTQAKSLPEDAPSAERERQHVGYTTAEPLQAVETGYGPEVESALLREMLARSIGMSEGLADPSEVHSYDSPLARANAYKHRLQALRCECADVRLRALDAEERLQEARSRIAKLESELQEMNLQLQAMRASRAWKLALRLVRLKQTFSRLLPRR